jgi:hypothetical protein
MPKKKKKQKQKQKGCMTNELRYYNNKKKKKKKLLSVGSTRVDRALAQISVCVEPMHM